MSSAWKFGFAINNRVRVIGPLAEEYACKTGTVKNIYYVDGSPRYLIEFDNKERDDFFGSELSLEPNE